MHKGEERQMGRDSGGESRDMRWSSVAQETLVQITIWTTYSWNFGKIFGHVIAIIKPQLLPFSKFLKVNFQASYIHFFYVGVARECAQIF